MAKEKPQPTNSNAEEAVRIATKLIDTWEKATRPRLNDIQEKEENYFGKVRPRTSGRSNFPVPVLARYVDEMKSRLDESPTHKIDSKVSPSRKLIGKKASAIIDDLKKPTKGNWNKGDRNSKHLAMFAGYNAVDFYSEDNDGKFKLCFDPIDHNEFVFEVGGGNDLEKHSGVGRFPIWRTKGELKSRAETGVYNKEQVAKVIVRYNGSEFKKNDEFFKSKLERYKSLGIDILNNDYMGQQAYPLAQMQMTLDFGHGPERFLITFDYGSGVWVRFEPLKDVFPSGMYSIDLWQTHEDQNNVMCKAPVDDIFPFAEGIRVKVNQLFDNHTQQIYGQTGYDPNYVPDPSQLPWRQSSQLTKMRAYGGKPISQGIYRFDTKDMTESTIKFADWMDNFLVSVVGINPNDVSDEVQKVGIMFGQLQKSSARMGTYNKSYREMWERLLYRALWELKEHLDEKQAIQIIGTRGVEWHEFVGSELEDPADFDILIEGANVELEMSEARKKHQEESFSIVLKDPDLKKEMNPRKTVEMILKIGEHPDEQIKSLMDVANYGNEEMLARADLACEEIIKHNYAIGDLPQGEKGTPIWSDKLKPKLYPGADISFMQYILDYANKLDEDEHDKRTSLIAYGRAHKQIVVKNMAQKGLSELSKKGITPDQVKMPMPPGLGAPAQGGSQTQQMPPGPRQPSPAVHAKVKARGARPIGHMPIPPVKGAPQRTPSGSGGLKAPVPAR